LEPPKPRAKQLIHLLIRLAASNREEAPMNLRYHVELTETECSDLHRMLAGGKHPARRLKRAQILIAADAGLGDAAIEAGVGVGGSTVYRTKRRFVEDGLEAALCEAPRPGTERKLSGKEEALLIATAEPARRPRTLDARTARRRDSQPHRTRQPVARDGQAAARRERPQALAEEDVVHPQARRRLCRPHGGRARPLCRASRSEAAGRLLR
jgi:Winged helix-turn helix